MWEKTYEIAKLKKSDCKKLKVIFLIFAVLSLGLNFFLFLIGKPMIYESFPLGLAFFSIAIAFHSCIIAEEAKEIAIDSDLKMTTIATSDFMDITHRFEDLKNLIVGVKVDSKGKILWPGYWPGTGRSYYTWKCEQLMKRAIELLKWDIDPDYQEQLARFYYNGLVKGLEGKIDTINAPERANFRKMYSHIQKFNVDDKYKEYPSKILDISRK